MGSDRRWVTGNRRGNGGNGSTAVRTPLGNSVTADLEQLLWRWVQDVATDAEAATYRRRARAHLQSMSRPTDNQVTDSPDWPRVTRPGRLFDAEQQRIRDRQHATACWGFQQLAEHPEWRHS